MNEFEPEKIKISAMDKTWIVAINTKRDRFCQTEFQIDSNMTTMYD